MAAKIDRQSAAPSDVPITGADLSETRRPCTTIALSLITAASCLAAVSAARPDLAAK